MIYYVEDHSDPEASTCQTAVVYNSLDASRVAKAWEAKGITVLVFSQSTDTSPLTLVPRDEWMQEI